MAKSSRCKCTSSSIFSLGNRLLLTIRYTLLGEIGYLLSHLKSVVEHMEPALATVFLQSTRFLEPDFQGALLAVISAFLHLLDEQSRNADGEGRQV